MFSQRLGQLETLCKVIAECSAAVPMPEWPPYVIEADSYLQEFYFRHVLSLLEEVERKGITVEQIGQVLLPSRVSQVMHSVYGMSASDLTKEERTFLVSKLLEIIGARRIDPFCTSGKNHLLDPALALQILNRCQLLTKTAVREYEWNQTAKTLGRINALLFSLCDLLHVCQHAASHEFQGPYSVNADRCFIIREYYNLKPVDVWGSVEAIPIDYFATIEVYQGVNIHFSFFNHLIPSQSLPDRLVGAYASFQPIDKTSGLSLEQLEGLLFQLKAFIIEFLARVVSLEKPDWIRKYIEMHYYVLKPLANLAGSDWRPTEAQILLLESPPNLQAASAFHTLSGLSHEEKIDALERLYRSFIFGDQSNP